MRIGHNNKFFYLTLFLSLIILFVGASDIIRDPIPAVSFFLMAIGGNTIAVIAIVFPLLSCVPILLEYAAEFDSGFFWYQAQKIDKRKLFVQNYLQYILKGGLVIAIPSFLVAVFAKIRSIRFENSEIHMDIIFCPELALSVPFLYMCIIVCNIFLCGVVCASLGLGVYMLFSNKYVAYIIPFVYYLFSGIVLYEIHPQLSLTLLYNINITGMRGIETRLIHAAIIFGLGLIMYLVGTRRRMKSEQNLKIY